MKYLTLIVLMSFTSNVFAGGTEKTVNETHSFSERLQSAAGYFFCGSVGSFLLAPMLSFFHAGNKADPTALAVGKIAAAGTAASYLLAGIERIAEGVNEKANAVATFSQAAQYFMSGAVIS